MLLIEFSKFAFCLGKKQKVIDDMCHCRRSQFMLSYPLYRTVLNDSKMEQELAQPIGSNSIHGNLSIGDTGIIWKADSISTFDVKMGGEIIDNILI